MLSYSEFNTIYGTEVEDIHESIAIVDGKLVFNYDEKKVGKDKVSTKFGKYKTFTPYVKKSDTIVAHNIFSIYNAKGVNVVDILKAIKKKSNIDMDEKDYHQFVNRSALYIQAKLAKGIDTIIAPTSSSPMLLDILDNLKHRLSGVMIFTNTFKKSNIDNIKIDKNHPKITPTIIKKLTEDIARAKKDGYFEMKKIFVPNRKFLSGYLELVDSKILNKYVKDKNVMIFDDVLASGTTFVEMIRTLELYEPKSLIGTTIFKTS